MHWGEVRIKLGGFVLLATVLLHLGFCLRSEIDLINLKPKGSAKEKEKKKVKVNY